MSTNARRTGRTTNTVVAALCGMLRGQKVLLVMGRYDHMPMAFDIAQNWLKDNGWLTRQVFPITLHPNEKIIRFGDGSLRIRSVSERLHGLRFDETHEDHFTVEERERKEAEQRRLAACKEIIRLMREHGLTQASQHNRVHSRETSIEFS